eukprot:6800446-Prymnesium_polylepis.1
MNLAVGGVASRFKHFSARLFRAHLRIPAITRLVQTSNHVQNEGRTRARRVPRSIVPLTPRTVEFRQGRGPRHGPRTRAMCARRARSQNVMHKHVSGLARDPHLRCALGCASIRPLSCSSRRRGWCCACHTEAPPTTIAFNAHSISRGAWLRL